jgi:hypothetical protein
MGYTHYWERPATLSSRKFRAAARECRKAVEHLASEHALRVQFDDDSTLPAEFAADRIQFNGPGNDGHETFMVQRVYKPSYPEKRPTAGGLWFDFCKTARKPYDAAVCVCLIVLRHHFGEKFIVSTDGDDEEEGWPVARQVCQQVLGFGIDFSLLTTAFERLPRRGLPYTPARDEHEGKCYRFSNGWLMIPRSGAVTVHEPYSDRKLIASARNLTAARWAATVNYLQNALIQAVDGEPAVQIAPFIADARGTLHNWFPLTVLADALEERCDRRYRVLRALLPKVF